jgi:ABC-type proline/glycine betaine transport system permease subunit
VNALLLFLALDFALVALAVLLLLAVIIRRGRAPQYLALAALLIVLALGVWYTAIRTPPILP